MNAAVPQITVGIDYIPPLTKLTSVNLMKGDPDLVQFSDQYNIPAGNCRTNSKIEIHTQDGWQGFKKYAPYDLIHVGQQQASMPRQLVEQLALGGRMVIPVGTGDQEFYYVEKDMNGQVTQRSLMGVRYVPLVKTVKDEL